MLRAVFISLSKAGWAQRWITRWGLAWRAASRFVAGETIAQALAAVRQLSQQGLIATLDQLGEHTQTREDAAQATAGILALLDEIERENLPANVSIKLSQLGLVIDPQLGYHHLCLVMQRAVERRNFIWVDMEDSSLTDATLELVARCRQQGMENIGAVIQSCLYRSENDTRRLIELGVPVRLVKGAYQEPRQVAYPNKRDVDAAFDRLSDILLRAARDADQWQVSEDGRFPPLPAIASHDEKRIAYALEGVRKLKLSPRQVEFQLLYGIRRDIQASLVKQGYPVRIYVPYGSHWYPYFMRRLAERPANVWFFISHFFQR
ncbi:MAG: proline dehydrogenase family protein [Chloroflexota bacterium]|jgi:proline dehydrogenase